MAKKEKNPKKRWLYCFGKAILMHFYRLVYRIKIVGAENLPENGPVLLCCNHVAIKDPILLGVCLKRQICFMAKAELFENRFLGGLLRALGAFPVRRGTADTDALADAYKLLDGGNVLGIFIEGTRSKTGELQRPKTGAALLAYQSKATTVPACIAGANGKRPAPFKKSIVRFGKPIPFEELGMENQSSLQLRRASRKIMAEIADLREESLKDLGVPMPKPEEETNGEEKA